MQFSVRKCLPRRRFEPLLLIVSCLDRSVNVRTGYELDGQGIVVLFPAKARDGSLFNTAQTGPMASLVNTKGSFN
jgi:hypothetical protein